MRPHRSSTVATADPSDTRSRRPTNNGKARRPAFSTTAAVETSEPGRGLVLDCFTVDECSRASPSCEGRAAIARSKPAWARYWAMTLPMPLLAPVTRATFVSAIATSRNRHRLCVYTRAQHGTGQRARHAAVGDDLAAVDEDVG